MVAFGKAVLGMVASVERILGDHIMEGVASVPVDAMETARENFPHYLPASNSKIRYVVVVAYKLIAVGCCSLLYSVMSQFSQ